MNNKLNIAFTLSFIIACNAKGVECSQQDVSCIKTDVDSNVDSDVSETNTTTINTTTIVNGSGGSGGSNDDSSGGRAGSEVGLSGSGGSGGNSNTLDNDAGVVVIEPSDGGVPDSGGVLDSGASIPIVCDSATALPSDTRNWFATSPTATDWFQLTTIDGFSEDRCTYIGKIKWFYEGPDGYWESGREYDSPNFVFTIQFTTDGFVKGDYHAPTISYPNGYVVRQEVSSTGCHGDSSEEIHLFFNPVYRYFNCLLSQDNVHPQRLHIFRGTWVDDRPIMIQQYYPLNMG